MRSTVRANLARLYFFLTQSEWIGLSNEDVNLFLEVYMAIITVLCFVCENHQRWVGQKYCHYCGAPIVVKENKS